MKSEGLPKGEEIANRVDRWLRSRGAIPIDGEELPNGRKIVETKLKQRQALEPLTPGEFRIVGNFLIDYFRNHLTDPDLQVELANLTRGFKVWSRNFSYLASKVKLGHLDQVASFFLEEKVKELRDFEGTNIVWNRKLDEMTFWSRAYHVTRLIKRDNPGLL